MPAPRPKVRPSMGLHNLGRGGKGEAHKITTCKLCPNGVYQDQPHQWPNSPGAPLGISHDACLQREGLL